MSLASERGAHVKATVLLRRTRRVRAGLHRPSTGRSDAQTRRSDAGARRTGFAGRRTSSEPGGFTRRVAGRISGRISGRLTCSIARRRGAGESRGPGCRGRAACQAGCASRRYLPQRSDDLEGGH